MYVRLVESCAIEVYIHKEMDIHIVEYLIVVLTETDNLIAMSIRV